jgi:endonuclease YncB( thermonuclease family)
MKNIIIALSMVLVSAAVNAETYSWKVNRVNDGDTVVFNVDFLPPPLKPQLAVRVAGIDTPEKGHLAKCDKERELSAKATEFTKAFIKNGKNILVKLIGWDKYGGRVLGDIIVDGNSLSANLLSNGYAREYDGGTKKGWCN